MAERKKSSTQKVQAKSKVVTAGSYVCDICGRRVTLDDTSNFAGVEEIICCDRSMKKRLEAEAAK